MDGFQVDRGAFLAPFRFWRSFFVALLPGIVAIGTLLALTAFLPESQLNLFEHAGQFLARLIWWIALASFEWCWIKGIINRQQEWYRPLLSFDRAFCVYAALSFGLLQYLWPFNALSSYLESFSPVVYEFGERKIREPYLLLVLLQMALLALAIWVRIRLTYWPIDIAVNGRLRSPLAIWRMTRGYVTDILILWLTFAILAAGAVVLPAWIASLFFDESNYIFVWIAVFVYLIAVLNYAYLETHAIINGRNWAEMAVTS